MAVLRRQSRAKPKPMVRRPPPDPAQSSMPIVDAPRFTPEVIKAVSYAICRGVYRGACACEKRDNGPCAAISYFAPSILVAAVGAGFKTKTK